MEKHRVDPRKAAEIDMALWAWVRKKALRDKDLSAALDIIGHYAVNNSLLPVHVEVAESLMKGSGTQDVVLPVATPEPVKAPMPTKDHRAILARLQEDKMLIGRHGKAAKDLLGRTTWDHHETMKASELAEMIEKSALVYREIKKISDGPRSIRFADSMVEAFETWGCYTQKQLEASRDMVETQTGKDPLTEYFNRQRESKKPRERESDDDIPF